jgi:hypothetical protein
MNASSGGPCNGTAFDDLSPKTDKSTAAHAELENGCSGCGIAETVNRFCVSIDWKIVGIDLLQAQRAAVRLPARDSPS